MAEYLVIHTINSPEYGGGPIIDIVEADTSSAVATKLVGGLLELHDGDNLDIYRITSHKSLTVDISRVTSLV